MSSRHKLREIGMTSLYQSFLLNKDIRQSVYDNNDSNEVDPFLYTITIDGMKYKDVYIEQVNALLQGDWTFERLGYIEQAILIMACCELDLEVSPKEIVLDEAIILAKKYCDKDTYKLINGVLDKL
ncbi:MAG: transcription antitermination protein NusB [Erysipelotrichaceae bacterium]|nr:transcription antitermination protein NusB [Erysipelotrichaceae bacterium]MCI9524700.1 transcription antitermination protein NusB [Erysipelotrichaceae bacterium]